MPILSIISVRGYLASPCHSNHLVHRIVLVMHWNSYELAVGIEPTIFWLTARYVNHCTTSLCLVGVEGIEPTTFALSRHCSTYWATLLWSPLSVTIRPNWLERPVTSPDVQRASCYFFLALANLAERARAPAFILLRIFCCARWSLACCNVWIIDIFSTFLYIV